LCAYVWDKLVPLFTADKTVQVIEEVEALLIGDAREGIIRVLALQINHQLGKFVVCTKEFHALFEGLPSNDR
jgi:hypothetical protein